MHLFGRSIMISGLKELDVVAFDEVDQPMFFGDPPAPGPNQLMLQRLGLADPGGRLAQVRPQRTRAREGRFGGRSRSRSEDPRETLVAIRLLAGPEVVSSAAH